MFDKPTNTAVQPVFGGIIRETLQKGDKSGRNLLTK